MNPKVDKSTLQLMLVRGILFINHLDEMIHSGKCGDLSINTAIFYYKKLPPKDYHESNLIHTTKQHRPFTLEFCCGWKS